ncbi:hypothetical protein [Pedobacter panaciterrae]
MKKSGPFIVLLYLCCTTLFAQISKPKSIKHKVTKNELIADWEKNFNEEYSDCAFYNKYTAKQRLAKYPFSKTAKILAVSYKYQGLDTEPADNKEVQSPKRGLHINNGVLDTTTLIKIKTLDSKQIDVLTNLIFNTNYKKKDAMHSIMSGKCFEPRNAFIFLDSNAQVLDYLEICFTCYQSRSSSDKFDIGILCTQKYQMLSDYFKNIGVVYGTFGRDYHEEDTKEWSKKE